MVVERPMENKVSPKRKNIYVVCTKNKFPKWDRIDKRHIEEPGRCRLCKANVESIFHLNGTSPMRFRRKLLWRSI
jgi:hypothetical protein